MNRTVKEVVERQEQLQLVRPIGRGGFVEVWEARTAQGVPCAIKVSLDPLDEQNPAVAKELENLRLLMALTGHPHVVTLSDVWEIGGYLVTRWEYAPEGSLEDRLRQCQAEGKAGIPLEELLSSTHTASSCPSAPSPPASAPAFPASQKAQSDADFEGAGRLRKRPLIFRAFWALLGLTAISLVALSLMGCIDPHPQGVATNDRTVPVRVPGERRTPAGMPPAHKVMPPAGHSRSIVSVAFSPDGSKVLTGSEDFTAKLWDVASGKVLRSFEGHTGPVFSVAFSPDGSKVLTGSLDNTAKLWDVASGNEIRTFQGHSLLVSSVAFSPDGSKVLTGSWDNTAKLWDVASGEVIRTFQGHTDPVSSAAFSPDGSKVLTGSWDDTAKLWDVASGQEIRTFQGHTDLVLSVAFSPDGSKVLTGSLDNTAKLWDVASGNEIRTFQGHTHWVSSVAFSPDGSKVLTGSLDGTARLWDVNTGQEIAQFWHVKTGGWVVITPDGYFDYDGSPETLDAITLLEPGTERVLSPKEVRAYHRPDLVRAALQRHR